MSEGTHSEGKAEVRFEHNPFKQILEMRIKNDISGLDELVKNENRKAVAQKLTLILIVIAHDALQDFANENLLKEGQPHLPLEHFLSYARRYMSTSVEDM